MELIKLLKNKLLIGGLALLGIFLLFYTNKEDTIEFSIEQESNVPFNSENMTDQMEEQIESIETMKVDVKGAVKFPGVYSVNPGDRVIDVIQRAGGFHEDADEVKINLSAKVQDEMVIYVPMVGEETIWQDDQTIRPQQNDDGKVNINHADELELQKLPGIGPAKAQAIIEYRNKNGKFQKLEDLMNISGIGQKTFDKLKEHITI